MRKIYGKNGDVLFCVRDDGTITDKWDVDVIGHLHSDRITDRDDLEVLCSIGPDGTVTDKNGATVYGNIGADGMITDEAFAAKLGSVDLKKDIPDTDESQSLRSSVGESRGGSRGSSESAKDKKSKSFIIIIIAAVAVIAAAAAAVFFLGAHSGSDKPSDADVNPSLPISTSDSAQSSSVPVKKMKIGIIQHGLGNASKNCYEGFITELNERGLIDKTEIVYIVEDNKELCRDKIQKLVSGGCDLLYTIGRYASETAASITKDVPIVFGAVNSPDEVGLVESNESPGGNVTGVSSFTPCFEQIDLIKTILPQAKSLAVIYSVTEEDTVMQGIIASKEAKNINIKCDDYPIVDEKALKTALEKIKEAKTEVIYIPVDKFLSAHIDELNKFSYENKIPVICGDEATLELGAFATSEVNYISIGRKAAGIADDILFAGKSPSAMPVYYKHDCTNIVNKQVAEKLGIKLPATALNQVEMWEPPAEAATEAPKPTETKSSSD